MRAVLFLLVCLTLLASLAGCGGDREPVNEGKDRPIPKKDK
jgi:hypothetical protein